MSHNGNPIRFYKYQAAGNDFVVVDNREGKHLFSTEQISRLCDRKFGIGADGLITLEKDPSHDFKMIYFNRDGSEGFCGNGCRAIVHFANHLGIIAANASFTAFDGSHKAEILSDGRVCVSVRDVDNIQKKSDHDYFINTGTDHHVRFVKGLDVYPVVEEGRKVRYSDSYKPRGTNVNFVEMKGDQVAFRIYERGVEDETLSSGSGATACALVAAHINGLTSPVRLISRGGQLSVDFVKDGNQFKRIQFTGPVELVFDLELKA